MIEEIRIGSLGVIDSSTLELGPGLTVITGETGAGKTMVVTALGLLLGGRADSGAVRSGARQARIEGVVAAGANEAGFWDAFAAEVDLAGGEVEEDRVVLARNLTAEGRSRAFVGGAWCRCPRWRRSRSRWSRSTVSPTSTGCFSPVPNETRSTGSAGPRCSTWGRATATPTPG